jgi:YHS domain-containing protein
MVRKSMFLVFIVSFAVPLLAGGRGGRCRHDHHSRSEDPGAAGEAGTVTQKTCPVGGTKIAEGSFVDHEGKRVYLCCDGCAAAFTKDPGLYLKKLADMGEEVETIAAVPQKTCPVMGGAIDKEVFADHGGRRIYLCCEGCREPFESDPATYLRKLEEMGEIPERI